MDVPSKHTQSPAQFRKTARYSWGNKDVCGCMQENMGMHNDTFRSTNQLRNLVQKAVSSVAQRH